MERRAEFSECRRYRYSLWRGWNKDLPLVAVIGLNPSTADEIDDDPTIRRCIAYAKREGFGGLVMLNLFARRSTDPKQLRKVADPVGIDNDKVLKEYHALAERTIAAWGVHGGMSYRDMEVIRLLARIGPLYCLGRTKGGYPKHPLCLPNNAPTELYCGTAT